MCRYVKPACILLKQINRERHEDATNIPLMSIANNGMLNVLNSCLAAIRINLRHTGTYIFIYHNAQHFKQFISNLSV